MKFKKGDRVLYRGDLYTFTQYNYFDNNISYLKECSNYIHTSELKPAIIDNKLNRKLYPNYISKNGYLMVKS